MHFPNWFTIDTRAKMLSSPSGPTPTISQSMATALVRLKVNDKVTRKERHYNHHLLCQCKPLNVHRTQWLLRSLTWFYTCIFNPCSTLQATKIERCIHQESQVFPQHLSVLSVTFYSNVVNSEAVLTGCVTTKYSEGFELYKFHSIIYLSPYPAENIQQPCLLHTLSGQFTKTCNDKSIYHRLYVIFDSLKESSMKLSTEGGKIVSISFGSFHLINFIKLKK